MMKQVIAHLDMDCFFCACEEKRDPTLKGNPVIVGSTTGRGVVSTANYEARKYGVFSATPISKARKLCPNGIFLGVDMGLYRKESQSVMDALAEIADDLEQVSVDEAYMDLTEYSKGFNSLYLMARSIQKKVVQKTGLSCSIGVSKSRIVAKIASDFKKPKGITVVEDDREFLKDMPIGKMPGIGKVSKRYYLDAGIEKIGDLHGIDRFVLLENFGQAGVRYQDIAMGRDMTGLSTHEAAKSISKETTFLEDVDDTDALEEEIESLAGIVHNQLDYFTYKTVSVKIRYSDFETITRDFSLGLASKSFTELLKVARRLFLDNYDASRKLRLIGVKVSNLKYQKLQQLKLTDFF